MISRLAAPLARRTKRKQDAGSSWMIWEFVANAEIWMK
jgi:hypothetical protein